MADWIGSARSNYFKVKDAEAFKIAMAEYEVEVWERKQDDVTFFGIGSTDEYGSWPSHMYAEDGSDIEFEIWKVVAPHLEDGQVAVFQECGAEKLRYLTGWSVAIDNTGKEVWVSMNDIYYAADAAFGVMPSQASY